MAIKMNGLSIKLLSHPGETLKEVLEHENMNQNELAIRIGLDKKTINQICNGFARISHETAFKLEKIFNLPASFWNNLQSNYDETMLRLKEIETITNEERNILKNFPCKELIKFGYISPSTDKNILILSLRKFFKITNLNFATELYKLPALYRKSNNKENPFAIAAWLRICEIKTDIEELPSFNKDLLNKNLDKIKNLNLIDINTGVKELKNIFKTCGVSFNVIDNLPGAPTQGIICNMGNKLRLCLTIRQKYADIFWFSLFHEIGHLLTIKKDYWNMTSIEEKANLEYEKAADLFASSYLLDTQGYEDLTQNNITEFSIRKFAEENNVIPGIVVGRLQHDKFINYNHFNDLRLKYEWEKF